VEQSKIEKLAKFAGMLTSDHEGEIAVAARMATRILREAGITWSDLVYRAFTTRSQPVATATTNGFGPGRSYEQTQQQQRPAGRQYERSNEFTASCQGFKAWDLIRWADKHRFMMDAWENEFINSLMKRGPSVKLSTKQWQILLRIAETTGAKRHSAA